MQNVQGLSVPEALSGQGERPVRKSQLDGAVQQFLKRVHLCPQIGPRTAK